MAATKATIIARVNRMTRTDTPVIIDGDLGPYLDDALSRYGRDKPYRMVQDVTGSGAKLQAVPSLWEQGFSDIEQIVYPYEDEDSTVLERDEYRVDTIPGTAPSTVPVDKIRFASYEPAATETVRVWFTIPHTITDSACTIYASDESAFAHLVAASIETAKASYFLGLRSQNLESDLVDYGAKANEARALAKMHFDAYQRGLGIGTKDDTVRAAAVGVDIDTDPQYPGVSPMVHHGRRFR